MQKILEYLKNVYAEMQKVSWPTKDEVKSATVLVLVFSLFFAVVVMVFDQGLDKLMGFLLNL